MDNEGTGYSEFALREMLEYAQDLDIPEDIEFYYNELNKRELIDA